MERLKQVRQELLGIIDQHNDQKAQAAGIYTTPEEKKWFFENIVPPVQDEFPSDEELPFDSFPQEDNSIAIDTEARDILQWTGEY